MTSPTRNSVVLQGYGYGSPESEDVRIKPTSMDKYWVFEEAFEPTRARHDNTSSTRSDVLPPIRELPGETNTSPFARKNKEQRRVKMDKDNPKHRRLQAPIPKIVVECDENVLMLRRDGAKFNPEWFNSDTSILPHLPSPTSPNRSRLGRHTQRTAPRERILSPHDEPVNCSPDVAMPKPVPSKIIDDPYPQPIDKRRSLFRRNFMGSPEREDHCIKHSKAHPPMGKLTTESINIRKRFLSNHSSRSPIKDRCIHRPRSPQSLERFNDYEIVNHREFLLGRNYTRSSKGNKPPQQTQEHPSTITNTSETTNEPISPRAHPSQGKINDNEIIHDREILLGKKYTRSPKVSKLPQQAQEHPSIITQTSETINEPTSPQTHPSQGKINDNEIIHDREILLGENHTRSPKENKLPQQAQEHPSQETKTSETTNEPTNNHIHLLVQNLASTSNEELFLKIMNVHPSIEKGISDNVDKPMHNRGPVVDNNLNTLPAEDQYDQHIEAHIAVREHIEETVDKPNDDNAGSMAEPLKITPTENPPIQETEVHPSTEDNTAETADKHPETTDLLTPFNSPISPEKDPCIKNQNVALPFGETIAVGPVTAEPKDSSTNETGQKRKTPRGKVCKGLACRYSRSPRGLMEPDRHDDKKRFGPPDPLGSAFQEIHLTPDYTKISNAFQDCPQNKKFDPVSGNLTSNLRRHMTRISTPSNLFDLALRYGRHRGELYLPLQHCFDVMATKPKDQIAMPPDTTYVPIAEGIDLTQLCHSLMRSESAYELTETGESMANTSANCPDDLLYQLRKWTQRVGGPQSVKDSDKTVDVSTLTARKDTQHKGMLKPTLLDGHREQEKRDSKSRNNKTFSGDRSWDEIIDAEVDDWNWTNVWDEPSGEDQQNAGISNHLGDVAGCSKNTEDWINTSEHYEVMYSASGEAVDYVDKRRLFSGTATGTHDVARGSSQHDQADNGAAASEKEDQISSRTSRVNNTLRSPRKHGDDACSNHLYSSSPKKAAQRELVHSVRLRRDTSTIPLKGKRRLRKSGNEDQVKTYKVRMLGKVYADSSDESVREEEQEEEFDTDEIDEPEIGCPYVYTKTMLPESNSRVKSVLDIVGEFAEAKKTSKEAAAANKGAGEQVSRSNSPGHSEEQNPQFLKRVKSRVLRMRKELPAPCPTKLCFGTTAGSSSHQEIKDIIEGSGKVKVTSLQYDPVYMEQCGEEGYKSMWIFEISSDSDRKHLLSHCLRVKGQRVVVRSLDDVHAEEYRTHTMYHAIRSEQSRKRLTNSSPKKKKRTTLVQEAKSIQ